MLCEQAPLIDLDRLASLMGTADTSDMFGMLDVFVEELPTLIDDLHVATQTRDRQALADATHKARSAAFNAAAANLIDLLNRLEAETIDADWLSVRERVAAVEIGCNVARTFIALRDPREYVT